MKRRKLLKIGVPTTVFATTGLYITSTKSTDIRIKNNTNSARSVSISIQRKDGGGKQYTEEFTLPPNEDVTEENVLSNGDYHLAIENESTRLERDVSNEFCWDPAIYVAIYDGGGISLSSSECWLDYVRADR